MGDLSIQDLVVEYSSGGYAVRPLDGFNLDVAAGSLVILLGPSGCGKTTLLSCLGGILKPTSGAIKFGDVDVTSLDAKALSKYRRETVGIVFQAFNLVPSLTALENVMVPLRSAGMSRHAAREKAEQLLARVGLEDRTTHRRSTTASSGGSGDRFGPSVDRRRRADRTSRLHSGRGSAATDPRARDRGPDGRRRDPRQPDSPAGRSRGGARAGLR
jgi:putative ABC transport system ATP-binding protein